MNQDNKDIQYAVEKYKIQPKCEYCGSTEKLKLEDSRTRYFFEGEINAPNDPNRRLLLCLNCAEDHHNYWDDRWDDYYQGLM